MPNLFLQPGEGQHYFMLGDIVSAKVFSSELCPDYCVAEIRTPAGGGAPFLHSHPSAETFYVLEGSYEIYGEDEAGTKQASRAGPGALVHIDASAAHGYKNVGDDWAKALIICSHPSAFTRFLEEISVPMKHPDDPPPLDKMPSPEQINEILERHGVHFSEEPTF